MWKRWWLFRATDFRSLMYPCFTICRILGIFPYKINASTFETSRPRYIQSTVIICVCCIINILFIYYFAIEVNLGITRSLKVISYYIVTIFILIFIHVWSEPQIRLLQNIFEISFNLPPESYQKLSILIHAKDIFGTIFIIVQTSIYLERQLFGENYFNIVHVIFSTYMSLLEFQINMLYINCVCVLKTCFKKMNDNLAHMRKLILNDIKLWVPRLICHMPKNHLLLTKLKVLKKQYQIVRDATRMLNIMFSFQIIIMIIVLTFTVTFELYFSVIRWQNGLLVSLDWHASDLYLTSIIFYIIRITLLVWACETHKNQIQKFGTTIHDVLNNTNDEQIKDELRLFSLQILHQKDIFTVKGLTVDATLVTRIVSNVTTQMLIMIQFLVTSHSCDKKFGINIRNNS